MGKSIKVLDRVFIVLIAITFIIPGFLSIDQMFPEFLYLSIIQTLTTFYVFLIKKPNISLYFRNNSIRAFVGFLFISLISVISSTNFQLSIIEISVFFLFFITLLNCIILLNDWKFEYFISIIIILLLLEVSKVHYEVWKLYNYLNPIIRHPAYAGFSSNVNVTSFSILIKLPFLLYRIFNQKNYKIYIHIFLLVILFLSISSIFICYSRGAILSLIIILFLLLGYSIYKANKSFLFIFLALVSAYLFNSVLFMNSETTVAKRAVTFELDKSDSSINSRI